MTSGYRSKSCIKIEKEGGRNKEFALFARFGGWRGLREDISAKTRAALSMDVD
jgi:hypothetical protein